MAYATAMEMARETVSEIASAMPQSERRRVMAAMAVLTGESAPRFMIEIVHDDDPPNPRYWDNLGAMACWHRRYTLGDKHGYSDPADFMKDLAKNSVTTGELVDFVKSGQADGLRFEERGKGGNKTVALMCYWSYGKQWSEEYEAPAPLDTGQWELRETILNSLGIDDLQKLAENHNIIMPLYLYDHSGITMSTGDFNDRFDSGQVGYTYISHKQIAEEYGEASPENIDKARKCLTSEVEDYDCYLRGECYGFRLYDYGEEIDSCYGFLGSFNDAKTAIVEYLPTLAAAAVKEMEYYNPIAEYDEETGDGSEREGGGEPGNERNDEPGGGRGHGEGFFEDDEEAGGGRDNEDDEDFFEGGEADGDQGDEDGEDEPEGGF